jgi:hypothetical protein
MSVVVRTLAVLTVAVTLALWAAPAPASAGVGATVCTLGGWFSGVVGKLCTVATHAGRVLDAGKKLAGGHVGGAIGALTGSAGKTVARAAGLAAVAAAVVGGAQYALKLTVAAIGGSTDPDVRAGWFSASYWRMAAVAALLTVPFLFAAAIQAMLRSDLSLLLRAAFGYLPLGLLAVGIAAPLTALLLTGSDEMSSIVSSASGRAGASFLDRVAGLGGLISAGSGALFVSFFIALFTTAAAITLWLELLIRQAAVYVIVLMLPLFFAAMVWPARRIWAARAVEMLVALILSKFAIVAVLGLGGAALGHTLVPGIGSFLAGTTLVLLAAFSPWAVLRLLPLHELAASAVGGLRPPAILPARVAEGRAHGASDLAEDVVNGDVTTGDVAASITGRLRAFTRREAGGAETPADAADPADPADLADPAGAAGPAAARVWAPEEDGGRETALRGDDPAPEVAGACGAAEDEFGSTVRNGALPEVIEAISLDGEMFDLEEPYVEGPLTAPGSALPTVPEAVEPFEPPEPEDDAW